MTSPFISAACLQACRLRLNRALLVALGALVSWTAPGTASASNLTVYTYGTPAVGLPCAVEAPTAVLMGGGKDVRKAYAWMIKKANCGAAAPDHPGNVLVLRATGNGAYDRYIAKRGPVAAVQTLVIPDMASANDPALVPYVQNAAVIWIAGGDQADYYTQWKGTLLASLVQQQIMTQRVPFGGTSAGLMVLANFSHVGRPKFELTSAEALADPYNREMNMQQDFWSASEVIGNAPLPVLLNTVTDSHFAQRDRMGRTLAFMARNLADGWLGGLTQQQILSEHAIAVDEQTALLVEQVPGGHFQASIVTDAGVAGHAYLLNPTMAPLCSATGKTLKKNCGGTFSLGSSQVQRLTSDAGKSPRIFDLSTWAPTSAATAANYLSYTVDVDAGVVTSSQDGGSPY
jgi:cyanophycinase-like exopeptidase